MFCGKCGTQNTDAATFCKKCGTQLKEISKSQMSNTPETTPKTNVRRKPIDRRAIIQRRRRNRKIIIAVGIIVILFLSFVLLGGRSYKSTIKQYFNASFDGNAKKSLIFFPIKWLTMPLRKVATMRMN